MEHVITYAIIQNLDFSVFTPDIALLTMYNWGKHRKHYFPLFVTWDIFFPPPGWHLTDYTDTNQQSMGVCGADSHSITLGTDIGKRWPGRCITQWTIEDGVAVLFEANPKASHIYWHTLRMNASQHFEPSPEILKESASSANRLVHFMKSSLETWIWKLS